MIVFIIRYSERKANHPKISDGRMLPINRRQKTFPNGTLIVEAVQRSTDQGRYTCVARNSQAYTARGDLDVQVMGEYKSIVPNTFKER